MREAKEGYEPDDAFLGPTPEEEAEAAFYFFIQDLNHYAQSYKFGPRIWKAIGEETRTILENQMMLSALGLDIEKEMNGRIN